MKSSPHGKYIRQSRDTAAWESRERRRKEKFKGFGKARDLYITVAAAG